jgi:PleD family two-component response regulator
MNTVPTSRTRKLARRDFFTGGTTDVSCPQLPRQFICKITETCHEMLFVAPASAYLRRVTEPLALLLSSRGLIATQLAERLEVLNYRMATIVNPAELVSAAAKEQAMVVFADMEGRDEAIIAAVSNLRGNQGTEHIPVIGFKKELDEASQAELSGRGFAVAVNDQAILSHLSLLLQRALDIH